MESSLCNNKDSLEASILYTKKLIVYAMSNIFYLRGIFPEEMFLDRYMENINIKILNGKDISIKEMQILDDWIKTAFEGLDKRHVILVD